MSAALKLELFQNGALLQEVSVGGEVLWLGRGEDCAIRLEDRAISRRHVSLKPGPNGLEFEKKSKFGEVRMDGREVQHATLKGGECLVLGPYELRVVRQGAEAVASMVPDPAPAEAQPADFGMESPSAPEEGGAHPPEIALDAPVPEESAPDGGFLADPEMAVAGDEDAGGGIDLGLGDAEAVSERPETRSGFGGVEENGQTRVMSQAIVETKPILEFPHADGARAYDIVDAEIAIGRSQNCHVVLEDKKSSRKHAIILQKDGKFLLRDLGSSNGTLVNGERVDERELSSGDEIQIGDTRFLFKKVQADYEVKKAEFLRVPEELPPPPPPMPEYAAPMEPLASMDHFGGAMADPVMFEASPQDPPLPDFASSEPERKSLIGAFLDRYRTMPVKMQVIYGVVILGAVWLFLEDSEPEKKPVLQMGQPQKVAVKKDDKKAAVPVGPTFESLTPEQKAYVESQYKIAYEYYRNHEYDSSLLELEKIFALIQNYSNAREIEAFAREGKRKQESLEEERKRAEQERQAQIRLQSLIDQAGLLMDARKYKEAEALFPEIELLQPENSVVSNWRKRIMEENELLERQEKERARIAEIRRKAWVDYRIGEARLKAGDFFGALDRFDELLEQQGIEKDLADRIQNDIRTAENSIAEKRDPLIAKGRELEKALNYTDAYKAYAMAAEVDPTDEAAPAGMDRIRGVLTSKAKAVYSEGVIAESFSEFDLAEKKYREVLEIVPPEHDYFSKASRRIRRIISARKPASEGGPQ
jgi:pSer/pThr/pTyr-binding forkhead associated (FHA) protein/tetratricopeptide (TPR) repeat protein